MDDVVVPSLDPGKSKGLLSLRLLIANMRIIAKPDL